MDPEMQDAVDIKQEFRSVKEELGTDDVWQMYVPCDALTIVPQQNIPEQQSRATPIKDECYEEIENGNLILKCEEDPLDVTCQEIKTEAEKLAGTSGVLSTSGKSGNTSLAIPILQQENTSESDVCDGDEDISQQTDVDMCSFLCNLCNRKFNKLSQLQTHTVTHTDKLPAEIGIDSERPSVQVQRNKRSERRHVCSVCNKSFARGGLLNDHVRSHTGERPFCCKICNKSFTQRGNLIRHLTIHSEQRSFCCEICNKSFTSSGHLKEHMRTHTGERPFCCEICNKSFTLSGQLKDHTRTHTGARPFSCAICNKTFTRRGHLITHLTVHTGQRSFCCEICNKSFARGSDLKTHMRTHTGERPHCCDNCNKSFTRGCDLQRHIRRVHTGKRPFCCEICNKSFTEQGNLIKHVRSHSAE